jgi:hypothetical protein
MARKSDNHPSTLVDWGYRPGYLPHGARGDYRLANEKPPTVRERQGQSQSRKPVSLASVWLRGTKDNGYS